MILWVGWGISETKLPLIPTQSSQALPKRGAVSQGLLSAARLQAPSNSPLRFPTWAQHRPPGSHSQAPHPAAPSNLQATGRPFPSVFSRASPGPDPLPGGQETSLLSTQHLIPVVSSAS